MSEEVVIKEVITDKNEKLKVEIFYPKISEQKDLVNFLLSETKTNFFDLVLSGENVLLQNVKINGVKINKDTAINYFKAITKYVDLLLLPIYDTYYDFFFKNSEEQKKS